jgi:NTP-dependent ternary system trypsin peptidase co-occuring protein
MSTLVEFPVEGGGTVLVAATSHNILDADRPVFRGGGSHDVVERSSSTMQAAVARLKPAAQAFMEAFTDLPRRPDELSVTFGVELSAEAGAIIASTAAKANFSVTIVWKGDHS